MKRILTCYDMFSRDAKRWTFRVASVAFLTLIAGMLYVPSAAAESIVINTGTYGKDLPQDDGGYIDPYFTWNYTGNYSDPRFNAYTYGDPYRPGFHVWLGCHMGGGNCTQNVNYGSDAVGQDPYTGVQFYYASFELPAEAKNVKLAFNRTGIDDRMEIRLNDNVLGYWGGSTSGVVSRMFGLGSQPAVSGVTFYREGHLLDVEDDTMFVFGGTNVVRFWVNNTGARHLDYGYPLAHSSGNPSALGVKFTVTYDAIIDSDGDGVPDDEDICPGGNDSVDTDGDFVPNFCDPCPNDANNDADGDGVCGDVDVCPGGDDNVDTDFDGLPDFCDVCPNDPNNDADGDGVCGDEDNCPLDANSNQLDTDLDLIGDVCDPDDDADGICDTATAGFGCISGPDNCPLIYNPDQTDFDSDGIGDICDDDADNDGVIDAFDSCLFTLTGQVVNGDGCSISDLSPCEGDWKNHGAYVRSVAHNSEDFLAAGLITAEEKDTIVSTAAQSSCGSKK